MLWRHVLDDQFTFTKRQLGVLLSGAGPLIFVGALAAEVIRDTPGGIGTLQRLALLLGAGCFVIGLTLLPLGDTPA